MNAGILPYYAAPGVMTDPADLGHLFDGLPAEMPTMVETDERLRPASDWKPGAWIPA